MRSLILSIVLAFASVAVGQTTKPVRVQITEAEAVVVASAADVVKARELAAKNYREGTGRALAQVVADREKDLAAARAGTDSKAKLAASSAFNVARAEYDAREKLAVGKDRLVTEAGQRHADASKAVEALKVRLKAESRRILFLVDATGTMGKKLKPATEEIAKALDSIGPDDQYLVAAFTDGTRFIDMPGGWKHGGEGKEGAWAFLQSLKATGTGPWPQLLSPIGDYQAHVIWLVSDGEFDDDGKMIVVEAFRKASGKATVNTTTAYASGRDAREALVNLAAVTGGVCRDASGKVLTAEKQAPADLPRTRPTGESILKN